MLSQKSIDLFGIGPKKAAARDKGYDRAEKQEGGGGMGLIVPTDKAQGNDHSSCDNKKDLTDVFARGFGRRVLFEVLRSLREVRSRTVGDPVSVFFGKHHAPSGYGDESISKS